MTCAPVDARSFSRLESNLFNPGDVAELADAKVSKTFGITSRVGSIPTIPITPSQIYSGLQLDAATQAKLVCQYRLR